jgi:hypothetical protein
VTGTSPADIQAVDHLLDRGSQQVSIRAGRKMLAATGVRAPSPADIGKAVHHSAHRLGDAILPSRPPRHDTQIRRMRHAPVPATAPRSAGTGINGKGQRGG